MKWLTELNNEIKAKKAELAKLKSVQDKIQELEIEIQHLEQVAELSNKTMGVGVTTKRKGRTWTEEQKQALSDKRKLASGDKV